jgi:hypothetical protein
VLEDAGVHLETSQPGEPTLEDVFISLAKD